MCRATCNCSRTRPVGATDALLPPDIIRGLFTRRAACRLTQDAQQRLRSRFRGCGVLAGDQAPIDYGEALPVVGLLELTALALEFVFDQERNDFRRTDRLFLGVGESGHALAL